MSLKLKNILRISALCLIMIVLCLIVGWFCGKIASVEGDHSLDEKLAIIFGWGVSDDTTEPSAEMPVSADEKAKNETPPSNTELKLTPITKATTDNCTAAYGYLMLVNPNFVVEDSFIAARRNELISLNTTYGIQEINAWNGDNLIDAEAGSHLNEMLLAYKEEYPDHEMQTVSCFRSEGTSCGRLCMPTGSSDHHTGLACDLVDASYGATLDTDTYESHPDWQWLRTNSYKYGFIDRFPENWAGGPMSEPMVVDGVGSTGLFETWHYRYVGVEYATDIATGKYNNGEYDSLEHYLKARGLVVDLETGKCEQKDV